MAWTFGPLGAGRGDPRTRNQGDPGSLLAWDIKKGHVSPPAPACTAPSSSEKPPVLVVVVKREPAALQTPLCNREACVRPWAGAGPVLPARLAAGGLGLPVPTGETASAEVIQKPVRALSSSRVSAG